MTHLYRHLRNKIALQTSARSHDVVTWSPRIPLLVSDKAFYQPPTDVIRRITELHAANEGLWPGCYSNGTSGIWQRRGDEADRLQWQAYNGFSLANGWNKRPFKPYFHRFLSRGFALSDIGRKVRRSDEICNHHYGDAFDHPTYFRCGQTFAAITIEVYGNIENAEAKIAALAEEAGIAWHAAPNLYASIHNPGWTKFYVLCAHDHNIRWLPEQEKGGRRR
jgi:hypothetical protein